MKQLNMQLCNILLTCLLSISLNGQINLDQSIDFLNEIDLKIPQLLEECMVPGIAVAVIKNGEVIFNKGYGVTNLENNTLVTQKTGFNIASISKTITAWGVMKLVQDGKLNLDFPAENYLKKWHIPDSEYNINEVTIRRLLSHTAGINLHGYPGYTSSDKLPTLIESLLGTDGKTPPVEIVRQPGESWRYSGGGYSILQLIIEEVTGKRFEDYMKEEILVPLGMLNSSFQIDNEVLNKSSDEYNSFGEKIPFELFAAKGAAGLQTNLEDMIIFVLNNFNKNKSEKSVLLPETIKLMTTPSENTKGRYGLGYRIKSLLDSLTTVGHTGSNSGWQAYMGLDMKKSDGLIVLTNGRLGNHIYNKIVCQWVRWKTGERLGYECSNSIIPVVLKTLKSSGLDAALKKYKEIKESNTNNYLIHPSQLGEIGILLMRSKDFVNAKSFFELNIEEYPRVFRSYKHLAEVYLELENKEMAIKNYKKYLSYYKDNEEVLSILKELENN